MDPNKTLELIYTTTDDHKRLESLRHLLGWVARGGFLPRPVEAQPFFLDLESQDVSKVLAALKFSIKGEQARIDKWEGLTS